MGLSSAFQPGSGGSLSSSGTTLGEGVNAISQTPYVNLVNADAQQTAALAAAPAAPAPAAPAESGDAPANPVEKPVRTLIAAVRYGKFPMAIKVLDGEGHAVASILMTCLRRPGEEVSLKDHLAQLQEVCAGAARAAGLA